MGRGAIVCPAQRGHGRLRNHCMGKQVQVSFMASGPRHPFGRSIPRDPIRNTFPATVAFRERLRKSFDDLPKRTDSHSESIVIGSPAGSDPSKAFPPALMKLPKVVFTEAFIIVSQTRRGLRPVGKLPISCLKTNSNT